MSDIKMIFDPNVVEMVFDDMKVTVHCHRLGSTPSDNIWPAYMKGDPFPMNEACQKAMYQYLKSFPPIDGMVYQAYVYSGGLYLVLDPAYGDKHVCHLEVTVKTEDGPVVTPLMYIGIIGMSWI